MKHPLNGGITTEKLPDAWKLEEDKKVPISSIPPKEQAVWVVEVKRWHPLMLLAQVLTLLVYVGAIIALSPAVADSANAAIYNSWGPGKFDPRFNIDGKDEPAPLIPPDPGTAKPQNV